MPVILGHGVTYTPEEDTSQSRLTMIEDREVLIPTYSVQAPSEPAAVEW
jgi:hypothetical protein